jgi:hypothetical protein
MKFNRTDYFIVTILQMKKIEMIKIEASLTGNMEPGFEIRHVNNKTHVSNDST